MFAARNGANLDLSGAAGNRVIYQTDADGRIQTTPSIDDSTFQKYFESQARRYEDLARKNMLQREDVYQEYKRLVELFGDAANDMGNRANILAKGNIDTYRKMVSDAYPKLNSDLNGIIGYYAKQFGDQATLDYIRRQHPAKVQGFDDSGLEALILMVTGSPIGAIEAASTPRSPFRNVRPPGKLALPEQVEQAPGALEPNTQTQGPKAIAKFSEGSKNAGGGGLPERVGQVHDILDKVEQRQRTAAIVETSDGTRIVGGGARDLTPDQRAALGPGQEAARLPKAHAEMTVLHSVSEKGLRPIRLSVSRDICPDCQFIIEQSGGILLDTKTAIFPNW